MDKKRRARILASRQCEAIAVRIRKLLRHFDENQDAFRECDHNENHFTNYELMHYQARFDDMMHVYGEDDNV